MKFLYGNGSLSVLHFPLLLLNIFPHPLNSHSSLCLPTRIVVEQGRLAGREALRFREEESVRFVEGGEESMRFVEEGEEVEEEVEVMDRGLSGRDERDGVVKERKERVIIGEEEAEEDGVVVARCMMKKP